MTEKVQAAFLRQKAEGRLVVHLRNEAASVTGYEVTYAYLEYANGTRDARNEVRAALGLPAPGVDPPPDDGGDNALPAAAALLAPPR